jgi:hypothetical protein
MRLRHALLIAGAIVSACAVPAAFADLNYTAGSGTVIFDFMCFTSKHCSAHTPINSAGTEIFTSSTPGQVTGANGTFPTTMASSSVSAGAYAAGALAAGAFASGAGVDGWDLTQGAKADSACGTATGTCSVVALLKFLNTSVSAAIPAGSAIIGKVGIDQTTPGTTNGVQVNAALPAGTNTIGNIGSDPSQGGATPAFIFQALPATATTKIITASGSTVTYITSLLAFAGGTTNWTIKYGTGTNCGTGTTTLTGPFPLTAQAGFAQGNGSGAVVIVPSGKDTCITTDASVSGGTHMTYQQK